MYCMDDSIGGREDGSREGREKKSILGVDLS